MPVCLLGYVDWHVGMATATIDRPENVAPFRTPPLRHLLIQLTASERLILHSNIIPHSLVTMHLIWEEFGVHQRLSCQL